MNEEYSFNKTKSESFTMYKNGYHKLTAEVEKYNGEVKVTIEDYGAVVELQAPKEILVEFFAGIINILAGL